MSTHYPTFGRSSGFGSVLKSFTKQFRSQAPVSINPKVVGGGADQQALFVQLLNGSLSDRAVAAKRVGESLERFAISSIPELWYAARDMADYKISSNIRHITVTLFYRCISHDHTLSTSTKLVYFQDAVRFCRWDLNDSEAYTFVQAISKLTSDGRDIYELVMYNGDKNLIDWIIEGLNCHKDEKVLAILLKLAANCIKFNFSLIEDRTAQILQSVITMEHNSSQIRNRLSNNFDLKNYSTFSILSEYETKSIQMSRTSTSNKNLTPISTINTIDTSPIETQSSYVSKLSFQKDTTSSEKSSTTGKKSQVKSSMDETIEVIYSLVIYGQMPSNQYQETVELLCINTCKESFDCILNLANYSQFSVVPALCEIIARLPRDATTLAATIGAIIYLEKLLSNQSIEYLVHNVLLSFISAIEHEIPVINVAILKCWLALVKADLPFSVWYSPTISIFNLLSVCKIDPTNQEIGSIFKQILDILQQRCINREILLPKDKLVQLMINNCQILNSNNIQFILDYYQEDRLCCSANPFHQENTTKILNTFYDISPLPVLKLMQNAYISSLEPSDLIMEIFKRSLKQTDNDVLDLIMDMIVDSRKYNQISPFFRANKSQCSSEFIRKFSQVTGKIFVISLMSEPELAKDAYKMLIELLNLSEDSAIPAISVLSRIRATHHGNIYVTQPSDMDGLATAFGRNMNDESFVRKDYYKWLYPETPSYIPQSYLDRTSNLKVDEDINISLYFNEIIRIINTFVSWELFSYVWAHFCPQLVNRVLFNKCSSQMVELHRLACRQLSLELPPGFQSPKGYTKSDVQVAIVRTYSALLSYHSYFSKQDEDLLVNSLIQGLSSWEKTAVPCIHIMTVCCYEVPLSIKKYLAAILTTLQTRVSSPLAAAPILEFLASLIHLDLAANFTMEEFRRVFAIAFKYAQMSKERVPLEPQVDNTIQEHGREAVIDSRPSTASMTFTSQYVRELSLSVISIWFLKLSIMERRQLSSFLVRNLLSNEDSPDKETLSFVDFIKRFTFSDIPLDLSIPDSSNMTSWIVGKSIISISTDGKAGESNVIIRRASGVTNIKLMFKGEYFPSQQELVLPPHILIQLSSNGLTEGLTKPIPLIDDSTTSRALSSLDRIPTIELHKVGLLYIGPGQSDEISILSNLGGSKAYQEFIGKIGNLIRLQNCKSVYVGGLDTSGNTDGQYAISYTTATTQIIFHTTSLMPNIANDRQRAYKKRHIGNNYVNIFFDESGLPFNFNIIRSQFTFLNIVVSPHSPGSMNTATYYKIRVYRRHGVPAIFATSHFKLISAEQLPDFVRNLCTIANLFALVWHQNGQYCSNWAHRLNQIELITDKTINAHKLLKEEQSNKPASVIAYTTTQSFLDQLRESNPIQTTTETTKYEYVREEDDSLYQQYEFNSFS